MLEKDIQLLMDTHPGAECETGKLQKGVTRQRARTTRAGQMLYVAAYPVWDTQHAAQARAALQKAKQASGSTEAQRRLNAKNAQRKLVQLINANFGAGDLLVTCTYSPGTDPETDEQAHKAMVNLMSRLKRLYRKAGIEHPKYVYVTEITESAKRGRRYHHHMILEGGIPREAVEQAWSKVQGGICNSRRAQALPEGLTGFARYITKQVHGDRRQQIATRRRWCASKNLAQPVTTMADKKISRRRAEKIAQSVEQDPRRAYAALEQLHPGYRVLELEVRTSSYVSGAYIYATLTKDGGGGP